MALCAIKLRSIAVMLVTFLSAATVFVFFPLFFTNQLLKKGIELPVFLLFRDGGLTVTGHNSALSGFYEAG